MEVKTIEVLGVKYNVVPSDSSSCNGCDFQGKKCWEMHALSDSEYAAGLPGCTDLGDGHYHYVEAK